MPTSLCFSGLPFGSDRRSSSSLDGQALMVRLYNAGGYVVKAEVRVPGVQDAMIYCSSPAEEAGERLSAPVAMPAIGVLTLRVERK